MAADNTHEKLCCIGNDESFFTNSTSCKRKNDSVYNTTSSTFIYHSSSNNCLLSDLTTGKLNDTTNANSAVLSPLPNFTFQESQKKFKTMSDLHSHLQLRMSRINTCLKKESCKLLNCKNTNLQKIVYHKRIYLEGQMKVDFMYYLAKRHHFVPVTEKIFSFLHGKDIVRMSMVSKIWHNVVKYSPLAKKKKRSYLKNIESIKENVGCIKKKYSSLSSRRILADIGNII